MKKILSILVGLTLTVGLVGCGKSVPKKTAAELQEQSTKYSAYTNKEALVSATDAKAMLDKGAKIALLDVRTGTDYALGHAEGAINIWRPDFESKNYEFGGMAIEKEGMEKLLGSLGIDNETKILIYDGAAEMDAARVWWILDMYGYDNVALVDGGYDGWKAAGLATTMSKPEIKATEFKFPGETDNSKLAILEDVKAAKDNKDVVILDTRSEGEATGKDLKKGAFRKGRIPGSVWLEYKNAVGEDSTFKTAEELKKLFEEKGITKDKTIIPYCQSAVRSAHTTFVLTELLGYENVKNYDGSWIEWSYNKDLPIEEGEIK
ncbi:MAG: sulfurtransferase [Clostridiaceae bacterium]